MARTAVIAILYTVAIVTLIIAGEHKYETYTKYPMTSIGLRTVFDSFITTSLTACCWICSDIPGCTSLNFIYPESRCELSYTTDLATDLQMRLGSDVYTKANITAVVPTIPVSASSAPGTSESSVQASVTTTQQPVTSVPTTVASTLTSVPLTSESVTPVPLTSESVTPVPLTSESVTSVPVTSESVTSVPVTTESVTSVPVTTEPLTTVPVTTIMGECLPGWMELNGDCVQLFTDKVENMTDANDKCKLFGAYLTNINDFGEQQALTGLLDTESWFGVWSFWATVWIGGKDDIVEGSYYWQTYDESPFSDSLFWAGFWGQPDNFSNQDCTGMLIKGYGNLDDVYCSDNVQAHGYICRMGKT